MIYNMKASVLHTDTDTQQSAILAASKLNDYIQSYFGKTVRTKIHQNAHLKFPAKIASNGAAKKRTL